MDSTVTRATAPLKVLLEMRPALEGHAGIPQETRLLFRALSMLDEVTVEGLLQHPQWVLARGLPPKGDDASSLSTHQQFNRLGRVVISIEQVFWHVKLRATLCTMAMMMRRMWAGTETLTRFQSQHFGDYLWRRFFAPTLPAQDFDRVTRAGFRVARIPWNAAQIGGMVTSYLGYPVFPQLDTSDFELMISETPYPGRVSRRTQLIVRYHDAIPLLMPHTISDRHYHHAFHYNALRCNADDGAWFVCVSEATRQDLLSVFPQLQKRSMTIHNMVSHHYFAEDSAPDRIPEIVKTRSTARISATNQRALTQPPEYLLIVSTIEPRKNHLTLLAAWETLRARRYPELKLIVVGRRGWHHQQILKKFRPWTERGEVFLLEDVPAADLRVLYRHASLTVCPSFGEGFDFSGVEAMMSGGAVAASEIAVHREIYQDAAEYFNPYSAEDIARAIESVIDPARRSRREELVARGASVAPRYRYEAILPQWQAFLSSLAQRRAAV
jgi:glycosyltransferase involved in cell wall biosynthesis